MRTFAILLIAIAASVTYADQPPEWATTDLRAGIIGTDTSHVPAFTGYFVKYPQYRIRVVAAYKGGNADQPVSADRVEKFAKTIHEQYGVEIVTSIDQLLDKVDVVLLESVDGRPHLAQATPVLKAGKRVFIDKPLAASLDDARAIVRLSQETGTPFFSSSSYRFHPDVPRLRDSTEVGRITKVQGSSPMSVLAFHPDLYFYGIHGIEAMYAVLGPGCVSVSRTIKDKTDITTGTWHDGRIGVYYGVRDGDRPPPIKVWGTEGEATSVARGGYDGLLLAIAKFFHTGVPPVEPAETLEIFEFMTAAQMSSEGGGKEVRLDELRP